MSDVKVTTVVMAHPSRARFIPKLVSDLGGTVPVVWDRKNDRWDTGRRALLAHKLDPKATHVMVIQDDAVVSRDLERGVTDALTAVPDGVVLGLYMGRSRPFREAISHITRQIDHRTRWLTMSQLHWGVGVVIPVKYVKPMVAWCDLRPDIPNYDKRMSRWFQHQKIQVWYPWPSLVDHRVEDNPSLVRGRTSSGRYALKFLGRDKSATDIDWRGTQLEIGPKVGTHRARPKTRTWRRTS